MTQNQKIQFVRLFSVLVGGVQSDAWSSVYSFCVLEGSQTGQKTIALQRKSTVVVLGGCFLATSPSLYSRLVLRPSSVGRRAFLAARGHARPSLWSPPHFQTTSNKTPNSNNI